MTRVVRQIAPAIACRLDGLLTVLLRPTVNPSPDEKATFKVLDTKHLDWNFSPTDDVLTW